MSIYKYHQEIGDNVPSSVVVYIKQVIDKKAGLGPQTSLTVAFLGEAGNMSLVPPELHCSLLNHIS